MNYDVKIYALELFNFLFFNKIWFGLISLMYEEGAIVSRLCATILTSCFKA